MSKPIHRETTVYARFFSILLGLAVSVGAAAAPMQNIAIDGDMSDWDELIIGLTDPVGDISQAGTDITQFKVAHDETHLYIYAKTAGPMLSEDAGFGGQGRYYFLVFIDLDDNIETGFNPDATDPDCYGGAVMGNDVEIIFERDWNDDLGEYETQLFYGTGGAGELADSQGEILDGIMRIGPGSYQRKIAYKVLAEDPPKNIVLTADFVRPEEYTPGDDIYLTYGFSPDMTELEVGMDFRAALKNEHGVPNLALGSNIGVGLACESSPWDPCGDGTSVLRAYFLDRGSLPEPTDTPTSTPTATSTATSTPDGPTATPTETPTPVTCDTGYYLLDSFGGRHRVGNPPIITGPLYFGNKIASDMEAAVCSDVVDGTHIDLVVLDGFGAAHFVADSDCDIAQEFYFGGMTETFPRGRAVDLQMSADGTGLWVLTDYGAIFRAGTTKFPTDLPRLLGTGQTGALGWDVPLTGDLRDPNLPDPGGATLRAVSFFAMDLDNDNSAEGYVVLDSMGGRYHYDAVGNQSLAGSAAGLVGNEPQRLLDPDSYVWPFFAGLDIARDMEVHPTNQGLVILDGWDGIHPVPVDEDTNPVFFATNHVSESDSTPVQIVGMPYLNTGFDDPDTTTVDEGDPNVHGVDAASVFKDLEFSTLCPDGLYTLDRFGGIFAMGPARANPDHPVPNFDAAAEEVGLATGSPYFFPFLYAEDVEFFDTVGVTSTFNPVTGTR